MFYKNCRGAVMNFYTEVYMSKYKQLITRSFFSSFNKNIGVFEILTFEIFNEMLTNDVVSFEQQGPDC